MITVGTLLCTRTDIETARVVNNYPGIQKKTNKATQFCCKQEHIIVGAMLLDVISTVALVGFGFIALFSGLIPAAGLVAGVSFGAGFITLAILSLGPLVIIKMSLYPTKGLFL